MQKKLETDIQSKLSKIDNKELYEQFQNNFTNIYNDKVSHSITTENMKNNLFPILKYLEQTKAQIGGRKRRKSRRSRRGKRKSRRSRKGGRKSRRRRKQKRRRTKRR